jgi:hypothetical protein
METARIRTAQQEVKQIALAEEECAALHGFYLPIQLLNDIKQEARGTGYVATPPADSLENESASSVFLIDPLLPVLSQANGNQYILSDTNVARVFDMIDTWQGPFLNVQRKYRRPNFSGSVTREDVRRDFPMDPWGQPYRFFSPIGPIGQLAMVTDPNQMFSDNFSNGYIQNQPGLNDPFDRYTIVSFGPNQLLDRAGDPNNDDISYEFGATIDLSGFYRFFR